ncbi:MAG: DUF1800 domain-containing protein [Rhizobiaceae bacterium]|nr:DUF1800 domain-containing protein [Rhizobiaceae bacterium]
MAVTAAQARLAHLVLNRFGLGAKPGSIGRIAANPRAALLAEINRTGIADITTPGLPAYAAACRLVDGDFGPANDLKDRELKARLTKAMQPEIGFVERLVMFFSNHFSISLNADGAPRPTIGQFERSVIRRNVLGSFPAMLQGVVQHPAMLDYLNNSSSVGPNSPFGQQHGDGLNENLGREILELHTLGVGGGYAQADVVSLAKIITGWSVVRGWESENGFDGGTRANRGQFIWRANRHEPGTHRLLGQAYPNTGFDQGRAALRMLALHPSTAEHLAFKLVRHFITDSPTPAQVDPVARAYRVSRGNIKATVLAMLDLPDAFTAPLTKLRTPYELQLAAFRATGRIYRDNQMWGFYGPLIDLRNLPWERRSPDGYPDASDYWMSPDGMRVRLESSQAIAWVLQDGRPYTMPASRLAGQLFGAALSADSRNAVTVVQEQWSVRGMAALFMLPEFQWR